MYTLELKYEQTYRLHWIFFTVVKLLILLTFNDYLQIYWLFKTVLFLATFTDRGHHDLSFCVTLLLIQYLKKYFFSICPRPYNTKQELIIVK